MGDNKRKSGIRPVFIAYPAVYSLLMFNYLVYRQKVPFAGIILSTSHIKMRAISFSFLESFYILWKKSGLYYALYMFTVTRGALVIFFFWRLVAALTGKKLRLKGFNEIAKERGIPVMRSRNINNPETVNFMKGIQAKILVSAYNNQILKYDVCKRFIYRGINIHNSYLPDFSGLDSAFETIYQGVRQSGATIHCVCTSIDTGRILAQERISVSDSDTVFSLNIRQWLRGARMLPWVLGAIINQMAQPRPQDLSARTYPYRSFPDKQRVASILKRKRQLIAFRDIFIPPRCVYGLFGEKKSARYGKPSRPN